MFAPAQKNFSPAPRITITDTSGSKRASMMAASSCFIISCVYVFAGGSSSVKPRPRRPSTFTSVFFVFPSLMVAPRFVFAGDMLLEGGDARDVLSHDQRVDVVRALVGEDGLEAAHVAHDLVLRTPLAPIAQRAIEATSRAIITLLRLASDTACLYLPASLSRPSR